MQSVDGSFCVVFIFIPYFALSVLFGWGLWLGACVKICFMPGQSSAQGRTLFGKVIKLISSFGEE